MENYQTIEPSASHRHKPVVKDTIVSSRAKVKQPCPSQAELDYLAGDVDLDNVYAGGNFHRPTRTQVRTDDRLVLNNPYGNLSENDYEQRSPTVIHNYTHLNIQAVSGQKMTQRTGLLVEGASEIEMGNKHHNEPFLSALSQDNQDHRSSFELEVLQASIAFPDLEDSARDDHDAGLPVDDEQELKRNEINTSINLPPASLIAKKQTASKNIHENISSSFVAHQGSTHHNPKQNKFDDSEIGDLEENSIIMFRENSAYFDQGTSYQKVRQRSQQKKSLQGLLDNLSKNAPPLSKKSKAEKVKQKNESRDSEVDFEATNQEVQSPNG
jgi:hypothetical protein